MSSALASGSTAQMPDPTGPPQTPADRFYRCLELREAMLHHLDLPSLSAFMRVEKKGMPSVVRELYHTVPWIHAYSCMSRANTRQRSYLAAIRVIEGYTKKLNLSLSVLKRTGLDLTRYGGQEIRAAVAESHLSTFSPSVINIILPLIRRKCPGLQEIIFRCKDEPLAHYPWRDESWVVRCEPPNRLAVLSDLGRGVIDLYRTDSYDLSEPPSSTIDLPDGSTDPYTLQIRSDISFSSSSDELFEGLDDGLVDRWLKAVRDGKCFDHLYKVIHFDQLPISLGDVEHLYRRQIESGYETRLETILAHAIVRWDMAEFRSFANVASASLRGLALVNGREDNPADYSQADRSKVTFSDLPSIISILHHSLPNLQTLEIALGGIDTAETTCCAMLDSNSLDDGGTVEKLRIDVSLLAEDAPLFNVLRCLSRICKSTATVSVDTAESTDLRAAQTAYLQYLRRQPPAIRSQLATADLPSLGLTQLHHVQYLTFHPDGRPQGLWEAAVNKLNVTRRISTGVATAEAASFRRLLSRAADPAYGIEDISETATTLEMYQALYPLSQALYEAYEDAGAEISAAEGNLASDVGSLIARLEEVSDDTDSDFGT